MITTDETEHRYVRSYLQGWDPHVPIAPLLTTIHTPESCLANAPFTERFGRHLGLIVFIINPEEQPIVSHWAYVSSDD